MELGFWTEAIKRIAGSGCWKATLEVIGIWLLTYPGYLADARVFPQIDKITRYCSINCISAKTFFTPRENQIFEHTLSLYDE